MKKWTLIALIGAAIVLIALSLISKTMGYVIVAAMAAVFVAYGLLWAYQVLAKIVEITKENRAIWPYFYIYARITDQGYVFLPSYVTKEYELTIHTPSTIRMV